MAAITSLLLLSLLVAATPLPGSCDDTAGSFLIQCYEPTLTTNGTALRTDLLRLLRALPSAAASTGFASLRSPTGVAFARGLCFGESTAPSECRRCLSVAARSLASGCGATTRRAGVWSDRCFVAYADTDASTPREDAFRSRLLLRGDDAVPVPGADAVAAYKDEYYFHAQLVYMAQVAAQGAADNISSARMLGTGGATMYGVAPAMSTAHVLGQCARDRTEAECVRCLQHSARAVDWDRHADRHGGVAAAVLGFNCYLAFNVSTVLPPRETGDSSGFVLLGAILGGIAGASILIVLVYALCAALSAKQEKTDNEEKKKDDAEAAAAAGAVFK
ncbi:uncharacterized protein [Lolium perenne]|uniref:uncharacterized protein n=1 Tax=Lolium perenne TaxID=4522 RepID=UPI0021EA4F06|nr:uncharacterized protein LOC127291902 [Lolium perenne]